MVEDAGRQARRVVLQALTLGILSVLVAAAVHLPLIKRFVRGEFRETFFLQADYPGLRLITLQEAEDLWAAGEAVFFDARRTDPYDEGHVPRARNLPAADAGSTIPPDVLDLPRDKTLVVYCEGGACLSSLHLAKRLHDEGFRDVRVMTGGWEEWRRSGLPEDRGR